jgi:hypothetical protein
MLRIYSVILISIIFFIRCLNMFKNLRRRSYRLTGLLGGLTAALGCLFSSFASQFHQLFLSYGIITGTTAALWAASSPHSPASSTSSSSATAS